MSGLRYPWALPLGTAVLLAGCASSDAGLPRASADPARDAAIFRVLDQYLDALNELDMESHVATYHFPHYRHASGKLVVWNTPDEAMPILSVPPEERRAALRNALEPDWQRSEWTRRTIVQGDSEKAHVVVQFVRLRADRSVIKTFDSLYVMTFENGRWAIKGRSSFAP